MTPMLELEEAGVKEKKGRSEEVVSVNTVKRQGKNPDLKNTMTEIKNYGAVKLFKFKHTGKKP
jgi:hypothetical protein